MTFHIRPIEAALISLTVSRLGLAFCLTLAILHGATLDLGPLHWLTFVIAADVPNGVLARRLGSDSILRRIADSVVDRITVSAAFTAVIAVQPEMLWWLAPLIVRGILVATASAWCFRFRNTIVTGRNLHKLSSLSTGALGFAMLAQSPYIWMAAVIAWAINWYMFVDYAKAWLEVWLRPYQPHLYRYRTIH